MAWGSSTTDTCDGVQKDSEDLVTRKEKDQAMDAVLAAYTELGATIVDDDPTLCRILRSLEFSGSDRKVGEYLCSFLVT